MMTWRKVYLVLATFCFMFQPYGNWHLYILKILPLVYRTIAVIPEF